MVTNRFEIATLGGGCFWCLEAVYQLVKGVEQVVSGYAGGEIAHPTYEQVCSGSTGHAEVVQISFNPEVISFENILEIFWHVHDPTTLNRQGNDIGTQYRSVIFYHTERQESIARQSKENTERSGLWNSPIVTEIVPFVNFYPAESYHQDYYRNHPEQLYCTVMISPKLDKLRSKFAHHLDN